MIQMQTDDDDEDNDYDDDDDVDLFLIIKSIIFLPASSSWFSHLGDNQHRDLHHWQPTSELQPSGSNPSTSMASRSSWRLRPFSFSCNFSTSSLVEIAVQPNKKQREKKEREVEEGDLARKDEERQKKEHL